jgi:hypothetical protein
MEGIEASSTTLGMSGIHCEHEEFQVFAGIVTQVRQAIDKQRALLR